MKIKEFENGMKLTIPLLITRFVRGVTQNGSPYLSITLQDNTGEIEGKIWDVAPDQEALIKVGVIAEFDCEVNQYRNSLQLRIYKVEVKDASQYLPEDFVNASQYDTEFLREEITKFVDSIENKVLLNIVRASLDERGEAFYQYPAATRNHHDFVGGLATHVYGMMRLADAICELYPIYNRDLLMSGIALHDLGKVEEYTAPVLSEYSVAGKLLGHISIAHANVSRIAEKLGLENNEEVLLLRHLILSHHGQLEYGSPVVPMIKEAEILNFIDNMDARTNMFEKVYDNLSEGEFSPRIFALENRNFYKAKGIK